MVKLLRKSVGEEIGETSKVSARNDNNGNMNKLMMMILDWQW